MSSSKKIKLIAASSLIALCGGFMIWWATQQGGDYETVAPAPPPEASLLSITNTTTQSVTVKVKAAAEANPPAGFKNSVGKGPMETTLEAQQSDQFVFSDGAMPFGEGLVEVELEVTVAGNPIVGTYTFKRKTRVYVNVYDAGGSPVLDPGPGVTAK
jgi:hypothetical protein